MQAAPALGLTPGADTYNALMWGCVRHGQSASTTKVRALQLRAQADISLQWLEHQVVVLHHLVC